MFLHTSLALVNLPPSLLSLTLFKPSLLKLLAPSISSHPVYFRGVTVRPAKI